MPFAIGFRLLVHKDAGLRDAPRILGRNLRGGMESLGKRLKTSAQGRMRRDRGDSEKSLRIEVKAQNANVQLTVYSTLVQAFVDAYGMSRGKFPPFSKGTPLYRWASRKVSGIESRNVNLEGATERALSHTRSRRPTKVARRRRTTRIKNAAPLSRSVRQRAKDTDTKRLAFLAARAVFEKGIRPTHWNTKALDANKARILQELKNALSRAANEMSKG